MSKNLSPAKLHWWKITYADVRSLRDDPNNTPEMKEKLTNILAELILIKDE